MSSSRSKLTIDLSAIAHNWKTYSKYVYPARCSAVVKADAYGLGVVEVSRRLYEAGCRDFFVASLQEAIRLKPHLADDAWIYILAGVFPGEELACASGGFVPVLISLDMLKRWVDKVGTRSSRVALKVDTGMARLGLTEDELDFALQHDLIGRANVSWILSHLACAEDPGHELNDAQLSRFKSMKARIDAQYPDIRYSLANSAGCMLGDEYHFDLVRPGVALYGGRVKGPLASSLRSVVSLLLELIQLRQVPAGAPVGYGATSISSRDRCIAVAAGGYADGIFRSLGNSGSGFVSGLSVPIAGRISMDSTMFDVSDVFDSSMDEPFTHIELLGAYQGIDELARDAGVVNYEILTSLGERFDRVYIDKRDGHVQ